MIKPRSKIEADVALMIVEQILNDATPPDDGTPVLTREESLRDALDMIAQTATERAFARRVMNLVFDRIEAGQKTIKQRTAA